MVGHFLRRGGVGVPRLAKTGIATIFTLLQDHSEFQDF